MVSILYCGIQSTSYDLILTDISLLNPFSLSEIMVFSVGKLANFQFLKTSFPSCISSNFLFMIQYLR